jgi:integral membrane sensor domain MASE1
MKGRLRMFTKRMVVSIIAGILLGVFCIVGASLRSGFTLAPGYLFAFWFNRLLMGVAFGIAIRLSDFKKALIRGLFLGALVSFAFYSASGYVDLTGFLAGVVYGVIIESVAWKYAL